jgi:tetratricopeptide (TPR) repeat protein
MKYAKATAAVGLTAAALFLSIGALSPTTSEYAESPHPPDPVVAVQDRLKQTPGNWPLWAQLGQLYLEQARATANPSFYAKAEAALNLSLKLNQADNSSALAGLGALANVRHDFPVAESLAKQALALNPQHAPAYGVLADALTQLGRSAEATDAVQHMLDLDPGLPALARGAYDLEQHGRAGEARALWQRALPDAHGAQAAFVHEQLGNLAYHAGDLTTAAAEFDKAGVVGWHGLAKVSVALGQTDRARALYASVTAVRPDPVLQAEYAALLTGPSRDAQLALADAALALLAASGSVDDLAAAQVFIAHGDFAKAVELCQREWQKRQHADVADLLGWSLHLVGRDAEAIGYARQALSLGIQHREYQSHLKAIEESLP